MDTNPTPEKLEVRSIKHTFSESERNNIGGDLARSIAALRGIEADFDSVKSGFKSKITAAEAQIDNLSTSLMNGFEMRNEKCIVIFRPADRKKDYYLEADYRADVKKAVVQLTEDMTEADFAIDLIQAESKFDDRAEIELFAPTEKDRGLLIVGRLAGKWYTALRVKIGKLELNERLDSEQKCFKARPDAVRIAVKRVADWAKENLKDAAKGFDESFKAVVEANKERVE